MRLIYSEGCSRWARVHAGGTEILTAWSKASQSHSRPLRAIPQARTSGSHPLIDRPSTSLALRTRSWQYATLQRSRMQSPSTWTCILSSGTRGEKSIIWAPRQTCRLGTLLKSRRPRNASRQYVYSRSTPSSCIASHRYLLRSQSKRYRTSCLSIRCRWLEHEEKISLPPCVTTSPDKLCWESQ